MLSNHCALLSASRRLCRLTRSCINGAVRAHVDAVEEFTDILVLNKARLVDERRRPGGVVNVGAGDHELILNSGLPLRDLDTWQHVHNAHDLLAKEVTDLDLGAVVGDGRVDREVGIYKTHAVLELLLYADEEIVDVTAHCAHGCQRLGCPEPH